MHPALAYSVLHSFGDQRRHHRNLLGLAVYVWSEWDRKIFKKPHTRQTAGRVLTFIRSLLH